MTFPNEIAYVCSIKGVVYIQERTKALPLDVHVTPPSCVSVAPVDKSGAESGGADGSDCVAVCTTCMFSADDKHIYDRVKLEQTVPKEKR